MKTRSGSSQIIFSRSALIRATKGSRFEFRPRPIWEPYVEAVLARQRQEQNPSPAATTSERKTGVKHTEVITARLLQDERGWLRLAG
jgi:hypothetical protein